MQQRLRSSSRATAPIVFPSSNTSRTAPTMNSSENCRRARLPACFDPILAIVSTFRTMSTKPDQAHQAPESVLDNEVTRDALRKKW